MLLLLHNIFTNKYRDLFTVRLGVTVLLGQLGIVGGLARFLVPILSGFVGLLMDKGVFVIDISLDSLREGKKLKNFERDAEREFKRATARLYNEEEKQKIRLQYLSIIANIGAVGSPK
jgi:hypothetical protein